MWLLKLPCWELHFRALIYWPHLTQLMVAHVEVQLYFLKVVVEV